jgi:hypothetical protein
MNEVLIPSGDNYIIEYEDNASSQFASPHFVNFSGQGDLTLKDLLIRSDSPIHGEYGAKLSSAELSEILELNLKGIMSDEPFALDIKSLFGTKAGVALSFHSALPADQFQYADKIEAVWTFSDGHKKAGQDVAHVFAETGQHSITLDLSYEGTAIGSQTRLFYAPPDQLISIEFENGLQDSSPYSSILSLHESALVQGAGREHDAFYLDGDSRLHVDRENKQIANLDTFELQIGFNPNSTSESGVIGMLHRAWVLETMADGFLRFTLTTDKGSFVVESGTQVLTNGNWHDIEISFDSLVEQLQLTVNGETVGVSQAYGTTTATTGYDLVIGAYWKNSAEGFVDHIALSSGTSRYYNVVQPVAALVEETTADIGMNDVPFEEVMSLENSSFETLVDLNFGKSIFDVSTFSSQVMTEFSSEEAGSDIAIGRTGNAFTLGGKDRVSIDRDNTQFLSLDHFQLKLGFKAGIENQSGTLAMRHKVFELRLEADGSLTFKLSTDVSNYELRSDAGVVGPENWHDIAVLYEDSVGLITIVVDSVTVGSGSAHGVTTGSPDYSVILGSQWKDSAAGLVDHFSIGAKERSASLEVIDPEQYADFDRSTTSDVLLDIKFEETPTDKSAFNTQLVAKDIQSNSNSSSEPSLFDEGTFAMDGMDKILIDRFSPHLSGMEDFQLNVRFQMENTRDSGTLAMQHKVFNLNIDSNGYLIFDLRTDAGQFQVKSYVPVFYDKDWHDISIVLDSDAESLVIVVDGKIMGSSFANGTTTSNPGFDIVIGSLWSTSIQGKVNHFSIETPSVDEEIDTFDFAKLPEGKFSSFDERAAKEIAATFAEVMPQEHIPMSESENEFNTQRGTDIEIAQLIEEEQWDAIIQSSHF